MRWMRSLSRLTAQQAGVALIEFALIFPFLLILLLGGVEISRLLLIQLRVERAGYVIADITSQYSPATVQGAQGEISEPEIRTNIMPQLARVLFPYGADDRQALILSSIKKINGEMRIQWQVASQPPALAGCDEATPQTCVVSEISGLAPSAITPTAVKDVPVQASDKSATMAAMQDGSNLIVAEVFYRYQPVLQPVLRGLGQSGGRTAFMVVISPRIYAKRMYLVPRGGELIHLPPSFPVGGGLGGGSGGGNTGGNNEVEQ